MQQAIVHARSAYRLLRSEKSQQYCGCRECPCRSNVEKQGKLRSCEQRGTLSEQHGDEARKYYGWDVPAAPGRRKDTEASCPACRSASPGPPRLAPSVRGGARGGSDCRSWE